MLKVRNMVENWGEESGAFDTHGFYMNDAGTQLRFDATISFEVDHQQTLEKLQKSFETASLDYTVSITGDIAAAD